MDLTNMDSKTALNQFCQRFCKKSIGKGDIVYSHQQFVGQYQATVKLNCMQGQEFAGELAANQKEAEKAAAFQAILAFQHEIEALPAPASNKRKASATSLGDPNLLGLSFSPDLGLEKKPKIEPAVQAGGEIGSDPAAGNAANTSKSMLNSVCMKIVKHALEKNAIVYETTAIPGGYQSTVKMQCLPGIWQEQFFAGEVCAMKKDAEQSAAAAALSAINSDPELSVIVATPKEKKPSSWRPPKGRGKGKGKGRGWNQPEAVDPSNFVMSELFPTGFPGLV